MRIQLLAVLLLLVINVVAQERIPKSFSISAGHLLTKGFQVAGHYHLNTYDELRLAYSNNTKTNSSDDLGNIELLNLKRISLSYAKGIRFRYGSLNNLSIYLGSGIVFGREQLNIETPISNQSIGLRFFGELDIALAKKLSLYLRSGNSFMFTDHLGRNGALGVGIRGYF